MDPCHGLNGTPHVKRWVFCEPLSLEVLLINVVYRSSRQYGLRLDQFQEEIEEFNFPLHFTQAKKGGAARYSLVQRVADPIFGKKNWIRGSVPRTQGEF